MNCWHCERPGVGVCKFCGRGVCKTHAQSMPFVLTAYVENGKRQALVVDDVIYCGVCKPSRQPVEL